jgi:hypothetical protein
MVKLFEVVPPPGDGFVTATAAVPPAETSVAEIAAVSWLELTNIVVLLLPFQLMTELEIKPEPFTVRVKPALPAATLEGVRD